MKCFYHPQADAVGTCKHCHRGICSGCASERSGGLACRGRCEAMVDSVSALIERNINVGVRARPISAFALVVFLAGCAALFYLALKEEQPTTRLLLFIMAAWAFVIALGQLYAVRGWLKRRAAERRGPS